MGHAGNDNLADGIMSLKFNELIAERSNGRIVVEYHTNDTLGDEDELLQQVTAAAEQISGENPFATITPTGIRLTLTAVVVIPILCVYPFVQKFYVKGLMVGAVKG